jgi:hypothetical protein
MTTDKDKETLKNYLRVRREVYESKSTECDDINRRVDEIVEKKGEIEKDKDLKILYIFVSQDLTCTIYLNNRKRLRIISRNQYQPLIEKHMEILYNDTTAEEQIEDLGSKFYEAFIPDDEIRAELEGANINWVWIDCRQEEIYPFWEWLHTNKKENKKGYFWGDEYNIIRLPKNCEFQNSNSPYQIKSIAMISDYDCSCITEDEECIRELPEMFPIGFNEIKNESEKLNAYDCIHLVGSGAVVTKDLLSPCADALSLNLKFLFLNIRAPNDNHSTANHDLIVKLKKLFTRSAEIWIDTSWDLPDEPAPHFVKYFYGKELWVNEKNVASIATKTRKKIDENEKNLGCKQFWRFAYVVKGNPCAEITWAMD